MGFEDGWDSLATLVDGEWVERRPRRAEVAGQLRREARVMPWLAPLLPLAVPVPWVAGEEPLVVRHALVRGNALEGGGFGEGAAVGAFLRALHGCPVAEAVRRGLPGAEETRRDRVETLGRFRSEVLPLVPVDVRAAAGAMLDTAAATPADTVVHGDLGPEHVLVDDGRVSGVIDFGDAHVGDAAIDLAWALFGAPEAFAEGVASAYGVTDDVRRRALTWHQLGPWYEVTYGLDTGDAESVRSGLAGLLDRLTAGIA
ncbi:phosphotransferase [Nocardia yamanashiensis]|uniref:phosphotransferase n=1 Tax=Nocardia yamanashiensis TaxID=209247 RepID=UPI001E435789|nr:phosphotransferase [Nocardia yamanashiensis]UGT42858.1 phosphotransferase [Nocardia yamanashiensis]